MGKKNYSLNFDGFLDYAYDISNKLGDEVLLQATIEALDKSRQVMNIEIGKAMKNSQFNFTKGDGYSTGKARESLIEVSKMPIQVDGTQVTAYAGIDLSQAPEVLILAIKGTPHHARDKNLYNAINCKGKYRKEIDKLQEATFNRYLKEALKDG